MNANHNGDGRLDEAALTRLVNEYFTAVPGGGADLDGRPGAPAPEPPPSEPAPPEVTLLSPEPPRAPPAPPVTGPATAAAGLPGNDGLAALAAEAIRAAEALASAPYLPKEPLSPEQVAPASTRSEWDLRVRIALPTADPAVPTAGPVIPMADAGSGLAGSYAPAGGQAFYFIGPTRAAGPASAAQAAAPAPPVAAPTLVTQPALDTPVSLSARDVPSSFDVDAIRRDFPILAERVNGHQLVWLDNAATTQKPQAVIDRLTRFYSHENSNVHRGAHELAARATDAYEDARASVANFLGAPSPEDVVFARGTTEAINLVAQSWGRAQVGAGDEIVVSCLEHHANIVPWQLLAEERGAKLRVIPVDDSGQIILDEYRRLLTDRTRLVAITHVSNALGTILPVRAVIEAAHSAGARVLVDGAQAVAHAPVDVQELDPDFYVFSGHKVFGPTGIGALYGKADVLEAMPPWQGGGNMIRNVTFERASFQPPPDRFEAGTASIADAAGLATALSYVERIGRTNIAGYEHDLLGYATRALTDVPGLRLIGTAPDKAAILSFVLDGYRPEDVGSALNSAGIAVRAGHHCAQPILRRYGLAGTVRAALAMYNTRAEVDALARALHGLSTRRARS
jgi:cysteine desulfurase/selenocysteine lyase